MDDRLGQLRGGHVGVVIVLAAVGDPADRDGLLRAVLQAAQALDAAAADDGAAALDADVAARAERGALAAANARIADGELLRLAGYDLRPDAALELVEGLFRRGLGRDRPGEDVLALLCDRGFQAVFTEYNALPPEQRGSLAKAVFQYWFRNSAVLEALVQIHRTDILFDSLRRSSGLIEALQPMADDPARFDYFVAIITSSMIGVLTVWVEHGKTETENQMVQKLTNAFIEMAILELPG